MTENVARPKDTRALVAPSWDPPTTKLCGVYQE